MIFFDFVSRYQHYFLYTPALAPHCDIPTHPSQKKLLARTHTCPQEEEDLDLKALGSFISVDEPERKRRRVGEVEMGVVLGEREEEEDRKNVKPEEVLLQLQQGEGGGGGKGGKDIVLAAVGGGGGGRGGRGGSTIKTEFYHEEKKH
jgi:uncharacterized membrane protein YgcG